MATVRGIGRVYVLALALGLAACSRTSEPELLASANAYLDKGDPAAAILQMKTLLQKNVNSGAARYTLGRALLASGKAPEAVIELEKARELRHDETLVVPVLARALLRTNAYQKVTDGFQATQLPDPKAQADLQVSLSIAHAGRGQADQAEAANARALALAPEDGRAQLQQARLLVLRKEPSQALAVLARLTASANADADAWLLRARIEQFERRDAAAALDSYRKAAAADPGLVDAQRGVVAMLLEKKDLDGATAHVAQVRKARPDDLQLRVLEAQLAFARRDYAAARALLKPMIDAAPTDGMLFELAGAVEYHLDALPAAASLLDRAVKLTPNLPLARHTLAQTYLRLGQPQKALDTLAPELAGPAPRAETVGVAAQAQLLAGNAAAASELFQRLLKASPDDNRVRAGLALAQLGQKDDARAVAALEALARADSQVTADLALIAHHLGRNQPEPALAAIAGLERKQPNTALAAQLKGRALLLRRDEAGARESFERARSIDPNYLPALNALARLDLRDDRADQARARFEGVISREPKNLAARYALADFLASSGAAPQLVVAQLRAAVQAVPDAPEARLQLVDHLLARRDYPAALTAAEEAAAAIRNQPEISHALGRAQLGAGKFQDAVTTFNTLAAVQPRTPAVHLALANAYIGLNDLAKAEEQLRRTLDLAPDLLLAQQALIGVLVKAGRRAAAVDLARQVQKQRPAEAAGYHYEGDVELAGGNTEAALAAYRKALQVSNAPEATVKLHQALLAARRDAEAERLLATRLAADPRDAPLRAYLGDLALQRRDWPGAERWYRELVALQPANAAALNNLASVLLRQNKSGALAFAERADAASPDTAAVRDTLATALAADKQIERALAVQRHALLLSGGRPPYRLNLARLYLQAGDKAKARAELEALTRLDDRVPEKAAAGQLLATL